MVCPAVVADTEIPITLAVLPVDTEPDAEIRLYTLLLVMLHGPLAPVEEIPTTWMTVVPEFV